MCPRQVWHGFTNTGAEPLCVFETTCPPGPENAFRELSQLSMLRQANEASPDPEALVKIAAKYGVRFKLD
jgi:hypothetical protein